MSQWRRPARLLISLFLLVFGLGSGIAAQSTGNTAVGAPATAESRPVDDPEFARLVKEWTTKQEFSSPLVDHLPKGVGVPSLAAVDRERLRQHVRARVHARLRRDHTTGAPSAAR